jgi:hypothetical protein
MPKSIHERVRAQIAKRERAEKAAKSRADASWLRRAVAADMKRDQRIEDLREGRDIARTAEERRMVTDWVLNGYEPPL